ncbi:Snf7-domain-containing protein [Corynascus novoguineensis]|uniref:Snf7-domain-containing protein n=1 Tax=Corynascus novoguineensis TaxID=1126955 RepID=A0AAN7CQM4_9PEZI|nr:Snf7-domain-containing protein [Corynascus novoguineensis]
MTQSLLEYLVENEPAFRKARLPALYSDFQTQRTLNPDGYQANVSAWRRALGRIVGSGLAPSSRGSAPSLFVLNSDEQLLRALESKQYGTPLALGAVIREALAAKDLIPLREFLDAKESIYRRSWSVWNLASWTMKQLGVADMLKKDSMPPGQFVVVANVEEAGKTFSAQNGPAANAQSRFERTFTKAHFLRTFNDQLVDGKRLSETDMDILLRFLSRDKSVILYDGNTVKIKSPGEHATESADQITEEDASIAQLRELIASLTHQTALLGRRIDELTAQAKQAVAKSNRAAALAALRSKKLAESTLARRLATANQLEEVAAQIEQAADNVQLVRVMEASGAALASLHARVGGVEHVEEVVDRLREQMAAADEVGSILAESAGPGGVVVDEGEIDDELAALEGEEKTKAKEAERAEREERERREAAETRKRLEAAGDVPSGEVKEPQPESQKKEVQAAEDMMSRMSLNEIPER